MFGEGGGAVSCHLGDGLTSGAEEVFHMLLMSPVKNTWLPGQFRGECWFPSGESWEGGRGTSVSLVVRASVLGVSLSVSVTLSLLYSGFS